MLSQEVDREALVQWAVERWNAEVKARPMTNVHRRTLDSTWRQVLAKLGGDHEALLGPIHDRLLSAANDDGIRCDAKVEL